LATDAGARIYGKLVQRGLPAHVAAAFVANFADESGLDAGINEAAPLVPGSRGGFGLAQWTGPRRRALESYLNAAGLPLNSEDGQLDFLMWELQGPESAAARQIFAAGTREDAAAAVLNTFLRPAEAHRAAREAKYRGGVVAPAKEPGGAMQPRGLPVAPAPLPVSARLARAGRGLVDLAMPQVEPMMMPRRAPVAVQPQRRDRLAPYLEFIGGLNGRI
jgi:hypothetical protein